MLPVQDMHSLKRECRKTIAVTNFTAKPSQYFKNVLISLDWPDNIDVKSAQLEYRMLVTQTRLLLGEFDLPQNDETFWASHTTQTDLLERN